MRKNKHWHELTTLQKAGVIGLGSLQIALMAGALRDIRRRPAREIRGGKPAWIAAAFVNFVGPLAYFLFGRKR